MSETVSAEIDAASNARPISEVPRWRVILKAVAAKHHLSIDDLIGDCRKKFIIEARREGIMRLSEAGLSVSYIARVCRRERTTILFHINAEMRAKKLVWNRLRRAELSRAQA